MIEDDIVTAIADRLARRARAAAQAAIVRCGWTTRAAGWLDAARAARLARFDDVFDVRCRGAAIRRRASTTSRARTAALGRVARALAAEGALTAWRDERYAVAPDFGAPPWFLLERAAARYFGIHTYAVHVNGLVRARRRRRDVDRAAQPDEGDRSRHARQSRGRRHRRRAESIAATLVKEAAEEAGIDAALAREAVPAGAVHICREQPDGLQHETIFVHDLWLPRGVRADGRRR